MFCTLFKAWEKDSANRVQFNVLKEWFNSFPCNLDREPYDASQPHGETFGVRVDAQKDPVLLALFNRRVNKGGQNNRSSQEGLPESWLSRNRMMVLVGGSLIAIVSLSWCEPLSVIRKKTRMSASGFLK